MDFQPNLILEERKLTEFEILDILNSIEAPKCFHNDVTNVWLNNTRKNYQHSLLKITVPVKDTKDFIEKLKDRMNSKIQRAFLPAGTAVGVIAGQSIGQPVTQLTLNCIHYDEEIYLFDSVYLPHSGPIKIGEYVSRYIDGNHEAFQKIKPHYKILSLDENGNISLRFITGISVHPITKPLIKVTTELGISVVASQGESFLRLTDGKFLPTLGSDLKIGDIVPNFKTVLHRTKITSITEVPEDDHKFVYDLEVEDTRNFFTLKGFGVRDSFHSSGGIHEVLLGIPRIKEILNVTEDPKQRHAYVYFKTKFDSISSLRDGIRGKFIEVKMENIIDRYFVQYPVKEEPWHRWFQILFPKDTNNYEAGILFHLNKYKLFTYGLTPEIVKEKLEEQYDDIYCMFAPIGKGKVKNEDQKTVTQDQNSESDTQKHKSDSPFVPFLILFNTVNIVYKDYSKKDLYQTYLYCIALEDILSTVITGISGIKNVYPASERNEWFIRTDGTNLPMIYMLDNVDKNRTYSDDIWEIHNLFGLEAAKNLLFKEIKKIIGSSISDRHIKLLLSSMSYLAELTSVSRHGISRTEVGPFGKASFEEAQDNLIRAGVFGEIEENKGVSACITTGSTVPVGTGVVTLVSEYGINRKESAKKKTETFRQNKIDKLYSIETSNHHHYQKEHAGGHFETPLSDEGNSASDIYSAKPTGSNEYYEM